MRLRLLPQHFLIFIAFTVIIASCAKDGETGPPGATGPQGPAGPAGPAGATGANGAPGTANVIYSNWIDTTKWRADTIMTGAVIDTIGYFANISAPKLNLDMLNKGEIKVYVNAGSATEPVVFPLPFNGSGLFIDVVFFLNTIQLYSNGNLTGLAFRYILIPGGTAARSGPGGKTINWNNYAEVKAYLGLTD